MLMLIGLVILVGVVLWAINYLPFIDVNIKRILYVLIVVLTAIYLLNFFGIMPAIPSRAH